MPFYMTSKEPFRTQICGFCTALFVSLLHMTIGSLNNYERYEHFVPSFYSGTHAYWHEKLSISQGVGLTGSPLLVNYSVN